MDTAAVVTLVVTVGMSAWAWRIATARSGPRYLRYMFGPLAGSWAIGTFGTVHGLQRAFDAGEHAAAADRAAVLSVEVAQAYRYLAGELAVLAIAFIFLVVTEVRLRSTRA